MTIEHFNNNRQKIEKALRYGHDSHSIEDVRKSIINGQMQYWPGENSFIITEVAIYPQYYNLHGFLAGGETQELKKMLPELEFAAKKMGCKHTTLTGRKGWERAFKDIGYKPTFFTFNKEL